MKLQNRRRSCCSRKVVVTGSKIKKTQLEGPLQVLVITKEDIDNSGFRNLTEVLQTIPSANQSTDNESIQGSFTPNANELDLRNLGQEEFYILLMEEELQIIQCF